MRACTFEFIRSDRPDALKTRTAGRVTTHLVKANAAPETGTGWHRHMADRQIVFTTKGWAKLMYGGRETLIEAGDCVHQRPGTVHCLFDYSPDMKYLEIVGPADFGSIDMPAACEVPTLALEVSAAGLRRPIVPHKHRVDVPRKRYLQRDGDDASVLRRCASFATFVSPSTTSFQAKSRSSHTDTGRISVGSP